MEESKLQQELSALLNRHSRENHSNTPDFLLAEFMLTCLAASEHMSRQREEWFGRFLTPAGPVTGGKFGGQRKALDQPAAPAVCGACGTPRPAPGVCMVCQPAAPERNGFQIRFDGPPGPESGRFVECETLDGKGVSIGRWQQDGEYWLLVVDGRERAAEGSARKAAKSA